MEMNELVLVGEKVDATNIKWLVSELGNLPNGTEIFAAVPKKFTLELTAKEAAALYSVFNFIGGDPLTTARAHTDSVWQKLDNLGVPNFVEDVSDFIDTKNYSKYCGIFIKAPK